MDLWHSAVDADDFVLLVFLIDFHARHWLHCDVLRAYLVREPARFLNPLFYSLDLDHVAPPGPLFGLRAFTVEGIDGLVPIEVRVDGSLVGYCRQHGFQAFFILVIFDLEIITRAGVDRGVRVLTELARVFHENLILSEIDLRAKRI